MLGEHLKAATLVVLEFSENVEAVTADGFQPFQDILSLIPSLVKMPEVLKNKDLVLAEAKTVVASASAVKEYAAFIEDNLTLINKKAENIAERILEVIVAVFSLIEAVKPAAPTTV